MNLGKTLFARLIDFLPWQSFHRIVDRHDGDRYVKSMTCAEQFRVMAVAQLAYRKKLRNIEASLSAQPAKLYHIGFRQEIKRSTLADANEATCASAKKVVSSVESASYFSRLRLTDGLNRFNIVSPFPKEKAQEESYS